MRADLHTHTTCSDGKSSPLEIIERAQKEGLDVVSITDHDTVRAYSELSPPEKLPTEKSQPEKLPTEKSPTEKSPIKTRSTQKSALGQSVIGNGPLSGDIPTLIPGAEMTAKDEDLSVHLLAYGLDPQKEGVKRLMASQRTRRKQRVERIIDMLAQRG
ncbi:MAG: PHP domain-containing protein, partial [Balneolaceae bacterium]|nr:PHP domain-containing protein [Balneolaceae bacterium]